MTATPRADHLVAPAAVRPRPGPLHGLRALRARRRSGVVVEPRVRLGRGVRIEASPGARIVLEAGCVIGDGSRLCARGGEVRVGPGATLGERCVLTAHARIAIGSGAVLGDHAMAVDFDHGTDDPERPVRLQPIVAAPVSVGSQARIGHGASLLRGVAVGEDAVVGTNSVVTRDVPPGGRVGGVPARSSAGTP